MPSRDWVEDSKPATIGCVRNEIATLDKHLVSQFESQYRFHLDVIADLRKRIEENSRSIEALNKIVETANGKLDTLNQNVENANGRIDGMLAMARNRLAIRPFAQITMYPTKENEVPKHFPKTVAMFWSLQEPSNRKLGLL